MITADDAPESTATPARGKGAAGGWRHAAVRTAAATAAGGLMWAAFPPRPFWWAAPLGVAVLTGVVRGSTKRGGFWYGTVAGMALFVPLLSWSSTVGADAWVALAALEAGFLGLLGVLLGRLTRTRHWPLWTAAAWTAQEALRDRTPFGGFPWGRLAFSQADGPLLGYASVGGAPLVTFVTALLGALILWTASRIVRRPRPTLVATSAAGAALVLVGVGTAAPLLPPAVATVSVAAVQGNVPTGGLDAFAQERAVLDNHAAATRRLAADISAGRLPEVDLVLWPENSSDLDPYRDAGAYREIADAVAAVGVPTLVGAVVDAGPGLVANTGIVWDPTSGPGATYVKQHPVPFGEYLPFRSLLTRLDERFSMVPRDFVKGQRPGVLDVGPARLGDVICFEVAYDGLVRETVARGAQLLVVQTNNATFGDSEETEQQLAMSRLRAVEHGRSVVVVATSGISAVIGPDGSVRQRTGLFTAETLTADLALRDGQTPATRLGGTVELVLVAFLVVPAVAGWRRRRGGGGKPAAASVGAV